MRPSYLLAAVSAAALLTSCAAVSPVPNAGGAAPALAPAPTPRSAWAHEHSDVTPDPAVRYGRLPNGMRYALRQNKTPPGEAVVYLRIDAGSLVERDDQLGLAHFMEHMVFNGTRNVPEGEFVKRLERLGLSFGGDTNASTSFEETIYSLRLPSVRDEVVNTALLLMREAGGEALLETDAINRERGVVLSEERTRDGPGLRMARAQLDFFMKGQLPPKRFPIGTIEILQNAPRERFVEFYESYYRPENATLVVVGDFDPAVMEQKIRDRFSDWRNDRPAGQRPDLGPVAKRGLEVGTFIEPGVPPSITLAWIGEPELDPDSREERMEFFREQLGLAALNRRFSRIALKANPPFTQAQAGHQSALKTIGQTAMGAQFVPGEWRRALEALEQEQRRILQFGITKAELEREIINNREGLRSGVAAASTRDSSTLAGNILTGLSEDKVVTTPEDRLALFEETVRDLTPEKVSQELRRLFQGQGPLIFVTSPEPLQGGEAAVAQAYQRSSRLAVAPPSATSDKAWSYTNFGPPGRVLERRELADLGTTFVRFANGVRLTVRPSDEEKSRIVVSVQVGDGQLDLPMNRPSPSWAARAVLVEGGLGRLSQVEIDDALAGKRYGANFGIGENSFELSGSTRPEDFLTQMQVLTAFVSDPGWREEGLERAKAAALSRDQQLKTTPSGVLSREVTQIIRSGDRRFAQPSPAEIRATTVAEVRDALRPLTTEPIEVIITGDTTVDEAIRLTAQTFGALPPRREASFPAAAARTPFPTAAPTPLELRHQGRPDQAMAFIAWPTDDFPSDQHKARAVRILQAVLRLRLTDEIREKQAVTYSPGVQADASWAYPGFGYIAAMIEAPPGRLKAFFADTLKIVRSLREIPVTPDELNRAVGPQISSLRRIMETNAYWSGALEKAQTDPRRLQAIREAVSGLQRITPADVQQVAQEYLRDDKALRIVVVPEPKAAASGH